MISLFIRLLALIGLLWTGRQVAEHVSSAVRPKKQDSDREPPEAAVDGNMVCDPVCQTYIPKSLAIQKTVGGESVYFCSHECAAQFIEQQQKKEEP